MEVAPHPFSQRVGQPHVGYLLYGDTREPIEFDDRTLAHVRIVIGAKLRRHESFFLSWKNEASRGGGRASLWMDAGIPMHFKFSSSAPQPINRLWLEQLSQSANTATGLQLSEEPEPPAPATGTAPAPPAG